MIKKIILGTRGSLLARVQTTMVHQALQEKYPELSIEEKIVTTTADANPTMAINQPTREGVGVFTKQLEEALLSKEIDAAVHSLKDLPVMMRPGLELAAILPRAATTDLLISLDPLGLEGLSVGSVIGTSAPRRVELLRKKRSDLRFKSLRGNLPTRLRKLAMNQREHQLDGIILARAGLERLGYDLQLQEGRGSFDFDGTKLYVEELSWMLPAPGQGAIAIQVRAGEAGSTCCFSLNDESTARCVTAERLLLHYLGGGCHMALGALATIDKSLQKIFLKAAYVPTVNAALCEGEAVGSTAEEVALVVATQLGPKITK